MLWNFHGGHDSGKLFLRGDRALAAGRGLDSETDPEFLLLPSALPLEASNIETLILMSCSVLDINDYNNSVSKQRLDGTWPSAEDRSFGGGAWDLNTSGGANTVLLGYNQYAPFEDLSTSEFDTHPKKILEGFKSELLVMEAEGQSLRTEGDMTPVGDLVKAYAWMSANVKYADTHLVTPDLKFLCLHASAIAGDYYYYVPFQYRRNTYDVAGYKIPIPRYFAVDSETPVHRVHRDDWGRQREEWNSSLGITVKPVSVPGLRFTQGGS